LPENPREYPFETNGETSLLSFIVHLWQENSASDERQANWRGYITSVPNGKRHYFTNFNEIPDLIVAHLKQQK
jgi:hypothetical protein